MVETATSSAGILAGDAMIVLVFASTAPSKTDPVNVTGDPVSDPEFGVTSTI